MRPQARLEEAARWVCVGISTSCFSLKETGPILPKVKGAAREACDGRFSTADVVFDANMKIVDLNLGWHGTGFQERKLDQGTKTPSDSFRSRASIFWSLARELCLIASSKLT